MPRADGDREPATPARARLRRVRVRGDDWHRRDHGRLLLVSGDRFVPVEQHRNADMMPSGGGDALFASYPRFAGAHLTWRSWSVVAMRGLEREDAGHVLAAMLLALALAAPAAVLARLDSSDGRSAPIVACAILAFAMAAAALAGWARQWQNRLDERGGLGIQATLWDWLVTAPSAALRSLGAAFTVQAAAAAAQEAESACRARTTLLAAVPLIAIALLCATLIEPALAALIALAATLHAAMRGVIGLAAAAARHAAAPDLCNARETAMAMATALPEARLDGSQAWHLVRLEASLARERRRGALIAGWTTAGAVAEVGALLGALLALIGVGQGQAGLGVLIAELYLATLIVPAAGGCGAALAQLAAADRPGAETGAFASIAVDQGAPGSACPAIERLSLIQAGLSYPGSVRPALAPTDFCVARGEVVALTGASGAGKTTLLRLLTGHERPDIGAVRVNDIDLRALDCESFQARIAAVGQDEACPVATIRSIVIGQARIPLEQAREAIAFARLGPTLEALPMGLQTLVSSANLPSALIGKLFVARALARRPDMLFLDEALDAFTQNEQPDFLNDCRRAGMGVVIVTHNAVTAALADRIVAI